MVRTTTFTASQDGNWNDGATWGHSSPGSEGTDFPGINDVVYTSIYKVTVTSGASCQFIVASDGGELALDNDLTLKDASTAWQVFVGNNGKITSNGTVASPRRIKSASAQPTYPWRWFFEKGDATRTMTLDNTIFDGCAAYLGYFAQPSAVYSVAFNTKQPTDPVLTYISPPDRPVTLIEHECRGRDYSRIYRRGGRAATVTLVGKMPWQSFAWQMLKTLKASNEPIAFASQFIVMERCRIASISYQAQSGPTIPFTIQLVESI